MSEKMFLMREKRVQTILERFINVEIHVKKLTLSYHEPFKSFKFF